MNSLIFMAIVVFLLYFAVAVMRSYQVNREEPDEWDASMEPWTCPECSFYVQAGLVCIYCQTEKPNQTTSP